MEKTSHTLSAADKATFDLVDARIISVGNAVDKLLEEAAGRQIAYILIATLDTSASIVSNISEDRQNDLLEALVELKRVRFNEEVKGDHT